MEERLRRSNTPSNEQEWPKLRFSDSANSPRYSSTSEANWPDLRASFAQIRDRLHLRLTAQEIERAHSQADICNRGDGGSGGWSASEGQAFVDHRTAVHLAVSGRTQAGNENVLCRIESSPAIRRLIGQSRMDFNGSNQASLDVLHHVTDFQTGVVTHDEM